MRTAPLPRRALFVGLVGALLGATTITATVGLTRTCRVPVWTGLGMRYCSAPFGHTGRCA